MSLRDDLLLPRLFIRALARNLATGRDFEAIQAYIAIFMKIHGDLAIQSDSLTEEMEQLLTIQKAAAAKFGDLVHYTLSVINVIRGAPS